MDRKEPSPPLQALVYSFQFVWWEEVGYTGPEFVRSSLLCAAAILVLVFLLIPDMKANIPVIICTTASIVDVIGFFYHVGEPINGVLSIYTVICVGLSVDYSAHIGHIFKLIGDKEDGDARAKEALVKSWLCSRGRGDLFPMLNVDALVPQY